MGGYKYRIGTHNGASSSNPESTQLLKVVENDDGATMGVGDLLPPRVPKSSRHQSSPLSESRASWPCNKRWVLDHQYQRSTSCLNPEYRRRRQPRERTGSHQRPRAGRKEFSRPFEEVVTDGENNNLSSLLGSEHYTLKDVADSFRQLEYERDKTRGQSTVSTLSLGRLKLDSRCSDLGPSKEASIRTPPSIVGKDPVGRLISSKKGYKPTSRNVSTACTTRDVSSGHFARDYQTIPCSNPNNNKKCAKLPAPVFTLWVCPNSRRPKDGEFEANADVLHFRVLVGPHDGEERTGAREVQMVRSANQIRSHGRR